MSPSDSERALRTVRVAERVAAALERKGVPCAVIGAMALAVHKYPRATEDFDLATDTDPFTTLRSAAEELKGEGLQVTFHEPDADDPLGGVVDIEGVNFDRIQVVNFFNPLAGSSNNPGREAIQTSAPLEGTQLQVAALPQLVALKLYAGGAKSALDVLELLQRNQPLDVKALRDVCGRYDLEEALNALLNQLG